jgi:hypothetical protein
MDRMQLLSRHSRINPIWQEFCFFRFSLFVIAALFTSVLCAQFLTEALPDQDIGRPPRPPFITLLGIATPGKLITDPSLPPFGPVAQTVYEELRVQATPAGPAGEITTSITATWDEAGHAIEEIRKDGASESDTTNRYAGTRLISQETTFPNSRQSAPKAWSYWVYDPSGNLIEFRKGRADQIQNHDTNFKRDAEGRLTSFEYRQGPNDELFTRTELRYSDQGRTANITEYDASGEIVHATTQTLDGQGHVVTAVVSYRDSKTKKMTPPLKAVFRYDGKGRLVEQDTDAHSADDADEEDLPPGKVFIDYDDAKHTKTTSYSGSDGSLGMVILSNEGGVTTGFGLQTAGEQLFNFIDCLYDGHGNWTACRQFAKKPAGNAVVKMWRRKITYR